ncbi:PREDICTED: putative nuclease HARBI1 [Prunus dulcis]|uniref:PREDICTED: putative nuclease HARBI1 n=1 Tax=Prunus dulcis TaxID=3755 RepID=A0A5E4GM25_PRUDU|nr:PREDICTED: putative nuclease HARBI1 [Prunus dulcis]
MAVDVLKPSDPEFNGVPKEILRDSRYMPHFKKKWSILRDMPTYPFHKQVKIVIATMTLHNYIRRHAQLDIHFHKVNNNPNAMEMEGDAQEGYHITYGPGAQEVETLRNKIATRLINVSS